MFDCLVTLEILGLLIKDLILNSKIPFKIFLSFHSFSEVVSFPWCCTTHPCEDYVTLLEGGAIVANAIYDTHGRIYRVGNFKDLMYNACGTSLDWSYGEARIPFSYLIELRNKEHNFFLPSEEIEDCCEEALNGVRALAEFVDTKNFLNHVVKVKKFLS